MGLSPSAPEGNKTVLPLSAPVGYTRRVMDDSGLRIFAPGGACAAQPGRPLPAADVDIGVVYTYERQFMPPLLSSLAISGEDLDLRLILVDNASSDGAEQWCGQFPQTVVLRNDRRLHYAANLNRVLAVATSAYVLLLNTDMYFDPRQQCVAEMVRFMESHPDCGLAGCRLYRADGSLIPSGRRFQTLPVILATRVGPRRWFRRTLDRYLCADQPVGQPRACDWIPGCFLMIRRSALEHVGGLDAEFIKYFEDVDLCLRMRLAGWRVMYHGGTFCYHLEQRASRRIFSVDAYLHLRSYLRWIRKWGLAPRRLADESAVGRAG